ncbi:MAG: peptidoglycan bridge formation glycyltransferase FemA/FemB family protein [Bacillota bacterium]|nr:peptidoglycan bridge formation glycyltransferase FemA/FemB family protein [Bacillota bacterium]
MRGRVLKEKERERFDAFVAGHAKGHILQSWAWGAVKAGTGWRAHRLVLEDDDGGIRGAVSILERELPVVKRPIFYSPRGPVVDFGDAEAFAALCRAVRELAEKRGAVFWKIDPDLPAEPATAAFLLDQGFRELARGPNFEGVQPRFVFRLSLERELDGIFASFSSKTRYNIRLAGRRGVTVRTGTAEDLPAFYALLRETAERDRFLIRGAGYFDLIWRHIIERGYGRLFIADYQGEPIAATLAFTIGDKAWYIYGASGNRHRDAMPNYALQWAMICWAKELGCRMYDFRGVSGDLNPDNPLYGLYRFKKGFNGDFVEFVGEFDYVFAPVIYNLWQWGEPRYRRWRGRLAELRKRLAGGGRR